MNSNDSLQTESPKPMRSKAISMLSQSPKNDGTQRMSLPQLQQNRRNGNFTKRTEIVNYSQDIVLPRVNKSVNQQPSTKNLKSRSNRISFIKNKAAEENLQSQRSENNGEQQLPFSSSINQRLETTQSQSEKKKLLE